jgi:ElaB/YqjD/DUF883 family membrane-anchored ribosome-binding protein
MEKQQGSEGLGLGAKVNIDLRLGELTSVLDRLENALKETGDKARSKISEAVGKLREAGVKDLKEASQREDAQGEAKKAYERTVKQLQTAADRGDAEANKLLDEMKA